MLEKQNKSPAKPNQWAATRQTTKAATCVWVFVCVAAYHKMFNKTQLPHCPLPFPAPQSCYIWATAGFAQANIEMGQKRCENDLKYFFWQRRKMFSCSLSLSPPPFLSLAHAHKKNKKKQKKKCEAINNKAKSKTKFNKRDSKRNVVRTQHWTGQQTNQAPPLQPPPPSTCPQPFGCCLWSFGKIFKAVWPKDANKSKWKKGCRTMCGMCRICFCKELCMCVSVCVCVCVCKSVKMIESELVLLAIFKPYAGWQLNEAK